MAKSNLMIALAFLSFLSIFGLVNYVIVDETHYDIHVKATLIDVDRIDGGYSCKVKVQLENENDFAIDDIVLNVTILTEEGERYFSREESLDRLDIGGKWKKIFRVVVKEDPGDYVTVIMNGSCYIQGEYKQIAPDPFQVSTKI